MIYIYMYIQQHYVRYMASSFKLDILFICLLILPKKLQKLDRNV